MNEICSSNDSGPDPLYPVSIEHCLPGAAQLSPNESAGVTILDLIFANRSGDAGTEQQPSVEAHRHALLPDSAHSLFHAVMDQSAIAKQGTVKGEASTRPRKPESNSVTQTGGRTDEVFENDKESERTVESPVERERARVLYLQDTLINLFSLYESAAKTESANEAKHSLADLKGEREAGEFGAATRHAYDCYITWLQRSVPSTILEMSSLQLPLPPGCPMQLHKDTYDRAVCPQYHEAQIGAGKLHLDLNLDSAHPPDDNALDTLVRCYDWLAACNKAASEARAGQRDRILHQLIKDHELPAGWNRSAEENPHSWRASAEEMIDLAVRTRNYIEAMQSLYKASAKAEFPLDLPPGTKLLMEDENGKTHTIAENELSGVVARYWMRNARIRSVQLDLPRDLRQDDPLNARKILRLREWLTSCGDKVDQAVLELLKIYKNPTTIIMYGDQEVRNGKALLNSKGEFAALVDGRYVPKPGESIEETNLVGYDFQVEQIKDGPLAGKFKITQTIQAESAPWYAYQNIRLFGIKPVGRPISVDDKLTPQHAAARYGIKESQVNEMLEAGQLQRTTDDAGAPLVVCPKILGGDDYVPVRNGDRIELLKVANLADFRCTQRDWYAGERALTTTMDAAMLVSGTIEIGAAVKGARLAAAGAQSALRLTTGQATAELTKGAVRVGVAGAGILNNAGARDTEFGRGVNTARGIYFLGDIGLGLINGVAGAIKPLSVPGTMSGAEKVHAIIQSEKSTGGHHWVSRLHTGTQWAFKATEFGFAPVIAKDLSSHIKAIVESEPGEPTRDAIVQPGDGRGMQVASPGSFDNSNHKSLEGTRAHLNRFASILMQRCGDATREQVRAILEQTGRLLASTEEEKEKYRATLLKELTFSSEQIKNLELAHPDAHKMNGERFHFTAQQLSELQNSEKRKGFPPSVRKLADDLMDKRDKSCRYGSNDCTVVSGSRQRRQTSRSAWNCLRGGSRS